MRGRQWQNAKGKAQSIYFSSLKIASQFPYRVVMDALVISHTSALRAIRYTRQTYSHLSSSKLGKVEQRHILASCAPGVHDVDFEHLSNRGIWDESTGEKLDVLISSESHRLGNKRVGYHLVTTALPYDALVELEKGIYITSPAYTALLYSRGRSLGETVMLLMELAGTYTLPADATPSIAWGGVWPEPDEDEDNNSELDVDTHPKSKTTVIEQTHYKCEPVVTIKELKAMARQATSSSDRTFKQAVRLIAEGSASPAESICYAMLSLPMSCGGFGCGSIGKGFRLNHTIRFDDNARNMASGIPFAICDAYLEEANADIEYNGIGHELTAARVHDGQRNNGLKGMGISVIAINRDQMRDITALEAIAKDLYRRAGKQFRYRIEGYRNRQNVLLNELRGGVGLAPV